MSAHHLILFAGGALAAAGTVCLAAKGKLHDAAVAVAARAMAAGDAVAAETQAITDEAADKRAEARRQAKIDAAVAEQLEALEADIRKQVSERIDKEGAAG